VKRLLLAACAAVSAACAGEQAAADAPTWHRDVRPLSLVHCAGCHTENADAFAWPDDYGLAQEHAQLIGRMAAERRMPPWLPSDECLPLQNNRRLSQAQITTLVEWAKAGAPRGEPGDERPVTRTEPRRLTQVDVELRTPPYLPNSSGTDDYRCFVLDPALERDRELAAIDIVSEPPGALHHVVVMRTNRAAVQGMAAEWACLYETGPRFEALLGTWVMGTPATRYPEGTGIALGPSDVLLVEAHYLPGAPSVTAGAALRLELASEPVARLGAIVPFAAYFFAIPAHAQGHVLRTVQRVDTLSGALSAGGTLWGVMPHLHERGVRLTVRRGAECLIDVPRWDDRWQELYFYDDPAGVRLKPDDELELTCEWNNPEDHDVVWGSSAHDEMCTAYFYVTP
jgi:hypothetical protein